MKTLFILMLTTLIGLALYHDPGYLLIALKHWSLEMPLWLGAVVFLMSCVSPHILMNVWHYLASLEQRLRIWRGSRHVKQARNKTSQGLIELHEGHWRLAEKYLTHAIKFSDSPLVNYLAAARAAHAQGAYDRRDDYLRTAQEKTPAAETAIGLTQVALQIQHQQFEQALATLQHLAEVAPKHSHILSLRLDLYLQLHDWTNLQTILLRCRKEKIINATRYDALRAMTAGALSLEQNQLPAAQQQLEKSIAIQPDRHAYQLLGEVHEALKQPGHALQAYRQAASLHV